VTFGFGFFGVLHSVATFIRISKIYLLGDTLNFKVQVT
jgi:hypothetical protein